MENCIVEDGSGHNYVIPYNKRSHWMDWIGTKEWDDGFVPEYADLIEGFDVVFEKYELR